MFQNEQPIVSNEDMFTKIVKKETGHKSIFLNAVYLKNSVASLHWSYYIYFYNKRDNICYIDDLNFYWSVERLSVTNTIEQLSTKILPFIKLIQSNWINKKFDIPKFIYFHNRGYWDRSIVRQKVSLKPLFNGSNELVWFCNPNWSAWNDILFPEQFEQDKKTIQAIKTNTRSKVKIS